MSRRTASRAEGLLVTVAFCLTTSLLHAQTGSITGAIRDASGGSVPEARITVESIEKGGERSTFSDAQGFYSVPELLVGHYNVSVQKSGFQTLRIRNWALTVAENLN